MMDNCVSVVIPVYNGEKSIVRCLESICRQTCNNLEIIIIDDGSIDSSEQVIQNYMQRKSFASGSIRFLHQKNMGVAFARNRGIREASGEYIAFVDQDDFIEKEYIETLRLEALRGHTDIVVSGYFRTDNRGKIIKKVSLKSTDWAKFVNLAPWGKLYRTSYLREQNLHFLDVKKGEDCYLNVLAYARTDRITMLSYVGYCWVDQEQSVTRRLHTKVSKETDIRIMFDGILRDMGENRYIPADLLEYYFIKASIYDVLFSSRESGREEAYRLHSELMGWLDVHFPGWNRNPNIHFSMPKGEQTFTRAAVKIYCVLCRLGLINLFLHIYCRR